MLQFHLNHLLQFIKVFCNLNPFLRIINLQELYKILTKLKIEVGRRLWLILMSGLYKRDWWLKTLVLVNLKRSILFLSVLIYPIILEYANTVIYVLSMCLMGRNFELIDWCSPIIILLLMLLDRIIWRVRMLLLLLLK